MTPTEVRALYAETAREYNLTPLAVEGGNVYEPDEEKLAELTACLQSLPANGVFLDVGTGMGIAPRFFHKAGFKSITVDNPATGGDAIENAMAAGVQGIRCDIMNQPLPLADNSVDCILFADVIEHLLHSPKYPFSEFKRVLKPGGVCVATTPNAMRLSVRIRVLMGASNWPALIDFFEKPYHDGHHHEYTINEFKQAFTLSGFEIARFDLSGTVATVNVASFGELQPRRRSGSFKAKRTHPLIALAKVPIYLFERLVPSFRPQMLVVARKPN